MPSVLAASALALSAGSSELRSDSHLERLGCSTRPPRSTHLLPWEYQLRSGCKIKLCVLCVACTFFRGHGVKRCRRSPSRRRLDRLGRLFRPQNRGAESTLRSPSDTSRASKTILDRQNIGERGKESDNTLARVRASNICEGLLKKERPTPRNPAHSRGREYVLHRKSIGESGNVGGVRGTRLRAPSRLASVRVYHDHALRSAG